jgi:surface protein
VDAWCTDASAAEVEYGHISHWDTSRVTNMKNLFSGYPSYGGKANRQTFNTDISQWDLSNVISMGYMFYGASSFNTDISQWDVSNVTSMGLMFGGASSFNTDISQWDVSNVTSMDHMLREASSFNTDISQWDVSKVTSMNYISMFKGCPVATTNLPGYAPIKDWLLQDKHRRWDGDISRAVDAWCTDATAAEVEYGHISHWDTSRVTNMKQLFNGDTSYGGVGRENRRTFNSDISQWDVSKVTSMHYMFSGASSFNTDMSQWDVSNVTSMRYMFRGASSFNKDISQWDISKVTDMFCMFYDCPIPANHRCSRHLSPFI